MAKAVILAAAVLLAGCGSQPKPAAVERADPSTEAWYRQSTSKLAGMARDAERLLTAGKADEAAAVITKAQPLIARLLGVPHPSLEAMIAGSDVDELYGHMLLSNGNYGWARLVFQKNVARWKNWTPLTDETERRRHVAELEIAECDKHIGQ